MQDTTRTPPLILPLASFTLAVRANLALSRRRRRNDESQGARREILRAKNRYEKHVRARARVPSLQKFFRSRREGEKIGICARPIDEDIPRNKSSGYLRIARRSNESATKVRRPVVYGPRAHFTSLCGIARDSAAEFKQ